MRILLLSCNTGGGHNSAANAICARFAQQGIDCDIRDTLLFISKQHASVVCQGHSYVYKHFPRLFGLGYRYEERHRPTFVYDQIALGAKKFANFLKDNHYDAVVTTHIFGNMLMTEARRKYGVTLSHYAVITDYALLPGTDMIDPRRFFIAAEELRDWYIRTGVSNDRLTVSGIPISSEFLNTMTKQEARSRLELPSDGKVILLFSGSIGCGKLQQRVPELEKFLPADARLVVICGNNKRLYRRLSRRCNRQKVQVVGFTKRVPEYMAASDLCLTKPGGLSTTELLATKLPMILMLSVPGCETHNLNHFESKGAAVSTDDWGEALRMTAALIRDDKRLKEMRERLEAIEYPGGANVVVETVLADLNERC